MIFPQLIKSIQANDKVLEIGPGGNPFYRSNVLLEKKYENKEEWEAQCGGQKPDNKGKTIFYYNGVDFPFKSNEFDYIICSHVLEHVDDVDKFVSEIKRVGKKGYFEFPLIYYDFLYNFPEHQVFLYYKDETIKWMRKEDTNIADFKEIQLFFNKTLQLKYSSLIEDLCFFFFQGIEWTDNIKTERVKSIKDLCHDINEIVIPVKQINISSKKILDVSLKNKIKSKLIHLINKM